MVRIKSGGRMLAAAIVLAAVMNANAHEIQAPEIAAGSFRAAETFLQSLSSEQQRMVLYDFEERERYNWHYVPRDRVGLPLKDMSKNQRSLAFAFLKAGLSEEGYRKAVAITKLEAVLREIETWSFIDRDPGKYYFTFFSLSSSFPW